MQRRTLFSFLTEWGRNAHTLQRIISRVPLPAFRLLHFPLLLDQDLPPGATSYGVELRSVSRIYLFTPPALRA